MHCIPMTLFIFLSNNKNLTKINRRFEQKLLCNAMHIMRKITNNGENVLIKPLYFHIFNTIYMYEICLCLCYEEYQCAAWKGFAFQIKLWQRKNTKVELIHVVEFQKCLIELIPARTFANTTSSLESIKYSFCAIFASHIISFLPFSPQFCCFFVLDFDSFICFIT